MHSGYHNAMGVTMNPATTLRRCLLTGTAAAFLLPSLQAHAADGPAAPAKPAAGAAGPRDGQHDFDFNIGTWKTHQSRLVHPLTGSHTWVEYNGTDVIRKIWGGRANFGEIEADGPAGHLELLSLRLYNPQTHQWSFIVANSATGTMSPPAVGEFKNGRGEFIDQEEYNGRTILVRFAVSDITADSCRFEQAFSDDGGKTWEVNFVVTETRAKDRSEGSDG
jgi:hypothetical protein